MYFLTFIRRLWNLLRFKHFRLLITAACLSPLRCPVTTNGVGKQFGAMKSPGSHCIFVNTRGVTLSVAAGV